MAAGSTYTPIATQTLSSSAASVTFSSISGAYTDLVLVCSYIKSTTANARIQVNGNTATNYSNTALYGDGTTAASGRDSSVSYYYLTSQYTASTTNPTIGIVNFMNYSNTTTYKTIISRGGVASTGTDATVGLWRSTAAITSIELNTATGTFSTGSTFTLYGIARA